MAVHCACVFCAMRHESPSSCCARQESGLTPKQGRAGGRGSYASFVCFTPLNLPSSNTGFTDQKMQQKLEGKQWTGHFTMASQGPTCIAGCWGRGNGGGAPLPMGQPKVTEGSKHQTLCLERHRSAHTTWSPPEVCSPPSSPHCFNTAVVTSSESLHPSLHIPSPSHSRTYGFLELGLRALRPFCRPTKATWGRWCLPSDLLVVRPSGHHLQRAQVSTST